MFVPSSSYVLQSLQLPDRSVGLSKWALDEKKELTKEEQDFLKRYNRGRFWRTALSVGFAIGTGLATGLLLGGIAFGATESDAVARSVARSSGILTGLTVYGPYRDYFLRGLYDKARKERGEEGVNLLLSQHEADAQLMEGMNGENLSS